MVVSGGQAGLCKASKRLIDLHVMLPTRPLGLALK